MRWPLFTYGAETMSFTKKSTEKFKVAQRAMVRAILGISLREHKTNKWLRKKTEIKDVISVMPNRSGNGLAI